MRQRARPAAPTLPPAERHQSSDDDVRHETEETEDGEHGGEAVGPHGDRQDRSSRADVVSSSAVTIQGPSLCARQTWVNMSELNRVRVVRS